MKKLKFLMIPLLGMLLFVASCKKEDVTKLPTTGTNPSTSINPNADRKLSVSPNDPLSPSALSPVLPVICKTLVLTFKDSNGNHNIRVTNNNGVYLYDIDNDGIVDYQIIPKSATDFSKLQCFGVNGTLAGELALHLSGNTGYVSKIPTDFNATSPYLIKYVDRTKSFSQWKNCCTDFTGSIYGILITTGAAFGGGWGAVAYAGGLGLGCYFYTIYKNYKTSNNPLVCLSTYTSYNSTVSGNVVTPIYTSSYIGDFKSATNPWNLSNTNSY